MLRGTARKKEIYYVKVDDYVLVFFADKAGSFDDMQLILRGGGLIAGEDERSTQGKM